MPNWNRFKKIVEKMIDEDLGGEPCTIKTTEGSSYDFAEGEIEGEEIVREVNLALIPLNYKDDLKDLPSGLRDKVDRRVFTNEPIPNNAIITSLFDNVQYRVIIPSAPLTAGGYVCGYRTYIGQIETELGTTANERNETV